MTAPRRYKTQGINGVSVFVLSVGAVILISGLTNKKISNVVQGYLAGSAPTPEPLGSATPSVTTSDTTFSEGAGVGSTNAGGTPSVNKGIGKLLAAPYGWATGTEWADLDLLWTRESGWQNDIANRSSGAFGIAQALGHGTASSSATTTVRYPGGGSERKLVNEYPNMAANSGNAAAQIAWGLAYIKQRYGSVSAAWAHEQVNSWY